MFRSHQLNWNKERPVRDVPALVLAALAGAFALQLFWHSQQPPLNAEIEPLSSPLAANAYRLASLGESLATAKMLNLWLQAYDNQPGISLSFKQLDYPRVAQWLDLILELDPQGRYPLLAAARIYGSVNDPARKRFMMDYVYQKFQENPDQRWPWLAYAVVIAKHELKDLPLALKYASTLNAQATGKNVPYWARDLKIIVLEDMGEAEAAKILVGGLLESGEITDPYELRFLEERIKNLEVGASRSRQGVE